MNACLMDRLKFKSSMDWARFVITTDLGHFMQDHASCERKASATALSFVVKYPNHQDLVESMICLAREELEHYYQVYQLLKQRGLSLIPDEKNPYVNALLSVQRHSEDERFMDRLLVSGLIEARSCERFTLIAEALGEGGESQLARFYQKLAIAERRHNELFVEHAKNIFDEACVEQRLEVLLEHEAKVLEALPWRPVVH